MLHSLFSQKRRITLLAALLVLVSSAIAAAAYVYPAGSWPAGRSYPNHAANWWQWALTQPASRSPLLDTTGANCGQGQPSLITGWGIWYLAGTLDGSPVVRRCNVPVSRTILIPLINTAYLAWPKDPADQRTDAFLRAQNAWMANADDLFLEIDGVAVENLASFFEQSTRISLRLPADNVYGITDPTELYFDKGFDAGYYVAIQAATLGAGEHTIHFGGSADGYSQDNTYIITVR